VIYTSEELKRWWDALSRTRQREIFDTMVDKAWTEGSRKFAESLMRQWDLGVELSYRQLLCLKRWDK
jgi:hypothetical protein